MACEASGRSRSEARIALPNGKPRVKWVYEVNEMAGRYCKSDWAINGPSNKN